MQSRTNSRAIAWVTLGTALFSLIYASGKFADGSASAFQILFLRYVGGLATLLAVVHLRGDDLRSFRSARPSSHFRRALFGAFGGGALIYASANMPIVDATALGLLYVVFVIPLGVVALKESADRRQFAAIALCSIGAAAIMASRGAFAEFRPAYILPAAVAVLGAALLAAEGLMIKMLTHSDRPMTVLLYVNAFGVVLMGLPAILGWQPISWTRAAAFVLLGPVAVFAQYCIVLGYRLAALSVVGPVDYSWLIFAGMIGFFFFGEQPTLGVVAGTVIIAIGGVFLALTGSQTATNDA